MMAVKDIHDGDEDPAVFNAPARDVADSRCRFVQPVGTGGRAVLNPLNIQTVNVHVPMLPDAVYKGAK